MSFGHFTLSAWSRHSEASWAEPKHLTIIDVSVVVSATIVSHIINRNVELILRRHRDAISAIGYMLGPIFSKMFVASLIVARLKLDHNMYNHRIRDDSLQRRSNKPWNGTYFRNWINSEDQPNAARTHMHRAQAIRKLPATIDVSRSDSMFILFSRNWASIELIITRICLLRGALLLVQSSCLGAEKRHTHRHRHARFESRHQKKWNFSFVRFN